MRLRSLNGNWKLYYYNQLERDINRPDGLNDSIPSVSCTVPGNVELDLSEAGVLPENLFFGANMHECERFETYAWWYEKSFSLTEEELDSDIYLRFGGVDTIADYYLNGIHIGASRNMMIPHEFCINSAAKRENTLYVRISSVCLAENEESFSELALFITPYERLSSVALRKAPHSYGWDIMPRAVSAGLWRDVDIVIKGKAEIEQFAYSILSYETDVMRIRFCFELKCAYNALYGHTIHISGKCGESEFSVSKELKAHAGRIDAVIENPLLWWPRGYGEQNLYDVRVSVEKDGEILCEKTERIGLRTVVLDNSYITDGENGTFAFKVNGTEVFCVGTNWVALDVFHSRDRKRYDRALALLADIGCNTVRLWGGNVYEENRFYDFCDENGIMVWQDFAMACNAYPQTRQFADEIEHEAISIIKRLRNHPSIVLWAGDNECDAITLETSGSNPNQNFLTREILSRAVFCHDFARPFLPSSPYVFGQAALANLSENHVWGPRDYYKSSFYKDSKAHFISEAGFHGCPSISSLERFLKKEEIYPGAVTDNWILHSTDWYGDDKRVVLVANQIKQMFCELPDNMEDFSLASQISQAEALKYFIERMRTHRPVKKGILWWNLLDSWPQVSDAVVDYYFEKKLAYSYVKTSQQPICVMADEPDDWGIRIVADNITSESVRVKLCVRDGETNEQLLSKTFELAANSCKAVGKISVLYSEQKLFTFEWEINGSVFHNHYISGHIPFALPQYKKWLEIIQKKQKNIN